MVVPETLSDGESAQDQFIASWKGLNYLPPDLTLLDNVRPTKEMKYFFWEHMQFDHMTDKFMTAWDMISEKDSEESESVSIEGW